MLLLGKDVAMRHIPASWLEPCDVFCKLKVCSTAMVTDMAVQKEKYQLRVKYTAGFDCKAIGLIQDWKTPSGTDFI